ncbi:MAG: RNA polymerase sigma factor [Fimbriimonadaceae bacterium]
MNTNSACTIRTDSDRRRFEELVEATRRQAWTMAKRLTGNPNDADDLLLETYAKAWRGFASYSPERPFANWLLRIMQHAHLDSRRRANPIRKAESLNSMVSPSDGEVQEIQVADPSAGPDEELFRKQLREELDSCLEQLPKMYRDAIVMCDFDGLTYSEIAEAQGTTVGTVRSRIHRGRKLLRELLLARSGGYSKMYA